MISFSPLSLIPGKRYYYRYGDSYGWSEEYIPAITVMLLL